MKEGRTKVVHAYYHDSLVGTDGVIYRLKLGLGPKEVATVHQVVFEVSSNTATAFFQAVSADPDEDGSLGIIGQRNDRNLMASRTVRVNGTSLNGMATLGSIVIPIPGGYDVAADMAYMCATLISAAVEHGVTVYYQIRKEAPGERESLLMARR